MSTIMVPPLDTLIPATPPDDAPLVRDARAGDGPAREMLAERCAREAYIFALQLTRRPDDARDLAQDAVIRVFGALDRFDPSRPLRPWLLQIVRNLVRDRARRARLRRHESLDDDTTWRPEPVARGRSPEETVARDQLRDLVWEELGSMREEAREIVVMRDYQDLTYAEIAEALAIPRGTVMSRLHRARAELAARVRRRVAAGDER